MNLNITITEEAQAIIPTMTWEERETLAKLVAEGARIMMHCLLPDDENYVAQNPYVEVFYQEGADEEYKDFMKGCTFTVKNVRVIMGDEEMANDIYIDANGQAGLFI